MWKERKEYLTQSDRQQAEIAMKIQDILWHQQNEVQSSTANTSSLATENLKRRSSSNTNMFSIASSNNV